MKIKKKKKKKNNNEKDSCVNECSFDVVVSFIQFVYI